MLRGVGRKDRQSRKLTPYHTYTDHFSRLMVNTSSAVQSEHPHRDQPWAAHATWQHEANRMKPGSCAGHRKAQEPPARGRGCRGANPIPTTTSIPKPQRRADLHCGGSPQVFPHPSSFFLQQSPLQPPWLPFKAMLRP